MPGSHSVVVCTYNAERELDLSLTALLRQSVLPGEVLIGDDGSGAETARLIESFKSRAPFPIRHIRHADDGVRKARIVNQCVALAQGERLLFLDGDCFPHRRWLEDHLRFAAGGRVLCGRRVNLGPVYSSTLNKQQVREGKWDGPIPPNDLLESQRAGDSRRAYLGIRLPYWMARIAHPVSRRLMGCNFSLPKAAFIEVNGYDEAWEGSALLSDDFDLGLRLQQARYKLVPIINAGIVYHVYHPPRPHSAHTLGLRKERETNAPRRALRGVAEL